MRRFLACVALLPAAALAADVDAFDPSGALPVGRGTLQAEDPHLTLQGPSAGVLASFAQDPVVRSFEDGSRVAEVAALLPVTLYGGYTREGLGRFAVFLPIYAHVDAPIHGFSGAAVGDIRLQGTFPFFTQGEGLAVALTPRLGLPSGSDAAVVGRGATGALVVSAGGTSGDLGYVADLGVSLAPADELEDGGQRFGSTLDTTLGAWWSATPTARLGAELDFDVGLVSAPDGANHVGTGHLFAQSLLPSGVGLAAGAGTGIVAGLGAPEYRVFSAITYARTTADRDRDGILDADDRCPDDPEDLDGFEDTDGCPDLDNDRDGVADTSDRCPSEPEDPDGFEDADGCPDPDNDRDGVLDAADACPEEPGPPEQSGCPDRDGDGVADAADACPDDPGPAELDGCPDRDEDGVPDIRDLCPDEPKPPGEDVAQSDGCPKKVYISRRKIEITERVEFETGKANLRPWSQDLLDSVAGFLKDREEIGQVEVGGHTDNVGRPESNQRLSERRAESVRTYLVREGVDPDRLVGKGYGQMKPIDTNRTSSGRQNNRRVEFRILEMSDPAPASAVEAVPAPAPAPPAPEPEPETVPEPAPVPPLVPTPAPDPEPAAVAPPPAGAPGRLSVEVAGGGWANVYVDNQRLSKGAPFADFPVSVGPHTVWVTNRRQQIDYTEEIVVEAGQSISIVVPLPEGGEAPAANPWTELVDEPEPEPEPEPIEDLDEPEPPPEKEKRPGRRSKKR